MNIYRARARPPIALSDETKEYRALLHKDWARYKLEENRELHRICLQIVRSQQKALTELRLESEELYQAAIQPDELLLPITLKGPVHTPPIKNYETPAEYHLPFQINHLLMLTLNLFVNNNTISQFSNIVFFPLSTGR